MKPTLDPKGGPWLIWSNHWGRWHRRSDDGGACGYTDDIAQAGLFEYPKANEYHDGPGGRDEAKPAWSVAHQLRERRRQIRRDLRALDAKIDDLSTRAARAKLTKLGPQQQAVLEALACGYASVEWRAYCFRRLTDTTSLSRAQVQRACKALRRYGLAKLEIGLYDDDGEPRGAGYRCTDAGAQWLAAQVAP